MNQEQRENLSQKLETGLLFLWGVTFLAFPLFVSTATTDGAMLPKQLLLAFMVLLSLLVWGVQTLLLGQLRIRRTPFDVPVLLFGLALILSSLFSGNRMDSLSNTVTIIYCVLSYFVLVNVFRTRKVALLLLSSLVLGAVFAMPIPKSPLFGKYSSAIEYGMYTLTLLPLTFSFIMPALKKQLNARVGVFAVLGLGLLAGLILAGRLIFTTQKPTLLPFNVGFQTGFAAISQDNGRILQTFLFGEGFGTFSSVFSRFHSASFNSNQQLWFLSFSSSSSFVLELLATTGLVGILAFFFLLTRTLFPIAKKGKNPFYVSLFAAFALSFFLPFSFLEIALLFFLLAGYTLAGRESKPHEYFDVELQFVALKKGVFAFTTLDEAARPKRDLHAMPIAASILLLAVAVLLGFYTTIYAASDITFQKSLSFASQNNGTQSYRLQAQAISTYPYRSGYYRVFAQTNIALANSLLALEAGKSSPSAQTQQTAFALIQQAITTARQATVLSPLSAVEWQNLSSVYRSLIGVGQNAQSFAIAAAQQAVALDPANPQEYLSLGGLYYQTGDYDNAIRAFQQATTLKNDYPNSYYNLAHAYAQKGDLQGALQQLQTVQSLVTSDKANADKVAKEIADLQARIASGGQQQAVRPSGQAGNLGQPLSLPQVTPLPSQAQQVPLVSPTPSK